MDEHKREALARPPPTVRAPCRTLPRARSTECEGRRAAPPHPKRGRKSRRLPRPENPRRDRRSRVVVCPQCASYSSFGAAIPDPPCVCRVSRHGCSSPFGCDVRDHATSWGRRTGFEPVEPERSRWTIRRAGEGEGISFRGDRAALSIRFRGAGRHRWRGFARRARVRPGATAGERFAAPTSVGRRDTPPPPPPRSDAILRLQRRSRCCISAPLWGRPGSYTR